MYKCVCVCVCVCVSVCARARLYISQVDTVLEGCAFFLERSAYHVIQPTQLSVRGLGFQVWGFVVCGAHTM